MEWCTYIMYTYAGGDEVSDILCGGGGFSFCGRMAVVQECFMYTVLHASTKERTQSQKSTQKRFPGNGNRSLSPWIDLSAASFRCFPDVSLSSPSSYYKRTAYSNSWWRFRLKNAFSLVEQVRVVFLYHWKPASTLNRISYVWNRQRWYHNNVRASARVNARAHQFIIIACRAARVLWPGILWPTCFPAR